MNNPFKLERVAVHLVEEPPLVSDIPLNSPERVVDVIADEIKKYDREVVAVINMQQDGRPLSMTVASIGQIESAAASPRDILKAAILSNATGIIMLHNHPSGSLRPSTADIKLTDKLKMACDLMDIQLLDHIIVGRGKEYYSFKEQDIMPEASVWLSRNIKEMSIQSNQGKSKESTLKRLNEAEKKSQEIRQERKSNPVWNCQQTL